MPWYFYAGFGLLVALTYGVKHFVKASAPKPPAPPEMIDVHLFGGPHHDTKQQIAIDDKPQFFIAQYLPIDEETGEPKQENVVRADERGIYFKPSYAFYLAVTDNDYFYVRDITSDEIQMMKVTGKLPATKPEV